MEHEIAVCGLDCAICAYREQTNCAGCAESKGDMFWGECKIAKCAQRKNVEDCSYCDEFVCDDLNAFSHDKEHGDNGERIENLRRRRGLTG